MNPFTKFLRRNDQDQTLTQFIEQWDKVEILAVDVFKAKGATVEETAVYAHARQRLLKLLPSLTPQLAPLWADTLAGGEIVKGDPFIRVLGAETAADFVGDWGALQHLPAAREALNKLVLQD